jgi:hypothetical protein
MNHQFLKCDLYQTFVPLLQFFCFHRRNTKPSMKRNFVFIVLFNLWLIIWILHSCALLLMINFFFPLCFHMVFNNSSLFMSMSNLIQILYINSLSLLCLSVTRRSAAKPVASFQEPFWLYSSSKQFTFCCRTCSLSPRTVSVQQLPLQSLSKNRFRVATAVAASLQEPFPCSNCRRRCCHGWQRV